MYFTKHGYELIQDKDMIMLRLKKHKIQKAINKSEDIKLASGLRRINFLKTGKITSKPANREI